MDAPTISVTAARDGFRRAGRAWSTTPQTVPLDELTEEQLEALVADPALVVVLRATGTDGQPGSGVLTPESIESGPPELDGPAITVTAHRDGFRRAGRAWSTRPETVALDELTEDQIEALCADPNLVVVMHDTNLQASKGGDGLSRREPPDDPGKSGRNARQEGVDPSPAPGAGGGEPLSPHADDDERQSAQGGGPPASPPVAPEDRHAAIVAAIAQVPAEGRTKAGAPKVEALEAVLGYDISASERDAAWATVQEHTAR